MKRQAFCRLLRIEGDKAFVPLTRGYEAIIDIEDVEKVRPFNWAAFKRGRTVYAARTQRIDKKSTTILLHRVLAGAPADMVVDHVDGDGLNNTRENIRVATYQQNQFNRRANKNNRAGRKGVHWRADEKCWVAGITISRKWIGLGRFKSLDDAAAAYEAASAKFHGEFARAA